MEKVWLARRTGTAFPISSASICCASSEAPTC
jgi:hypothetical protein